MHEAIPLVTDPGVGEYRAAVPKDVENATGSEHPNVPLAAPGTSGDGLAALVAAISGLLLLATSFVQPPDGPTVGSATAAQVRAFATDNDTALRAAATAGIIAFVLVVVFTAALARIVRARLPGSILASLVAAGGILVGMMLWLNTAATSMTVLLPDLIDTELARVDDTTVLSWYGLTGFTHFLGDLVMAPIALTMSAFSIAALAGGLLPRWLAWLGLAFAASGVVGTVGITTGSGVLYAFWFGGLFGWALWILLVSITEGLRWRRTRRRPALA